jgi:hypothetical protein
MILHVKLWAEENNLDLPMMGCNDVLDVYLPEDCQACMSEGGEHEDQIDG